MNAYFQNVRQYGAFAAGLAIVPLYLGTVLSGPFSGKVTDKLGPRLAIVAWIGTMVVGFLALATMSTSSPYWSVGLGLLLSAVGYGLINPLRVAVLMSSASDDMAGAASGANSAGVEFGTSLGLALSTTLSVAFGVGAFRNLLSQAGLTAEESQQAINALRGAMTDSLSTHNPTVSQPALEQLLEVARQAYATGMAQTMLIVALLLVLAGLIAWFGMRKYQTGPATLSVTANAN
jgi:MFS family permease